MTGKTEKEAKTTKTAKERLEEKASQKTITEQFLAYQFELAEKGNFKYASWSDVWDSVLRMHPDATYKWFESAEGVLGFVDDFGYIMTKVEVTIKDKTRVSYLPVMDYKNDPMKTEKYSYMAVRKNYKTQKMETVQIDVSAATSMDIYKTYQRCFVKALAMHGLGLYVYRGEDLPSDPEVDGTKDVVGGKKKSKQAGSATTTVDAIGDLMGESNPALAASTPVNRTTEPAQVTAQATAPVGEPEAGVSIEVKYRSAVSAAITAAEEAGLPFTINELKNVTGEFAKIHNLLANPEQHGKIAIAFNGLKDELF